MTISKTNREFVPNKKNRFYSGILLGFCFLFFILDFRLSNFIYSFVFFFVFPFIVGSLNWTMGKDQKRSNLMYSLTVSFFLFVQFVSNSQKAREFDEYKAKAIEIKNEAENSTNINDIIKARKEIYELAAGRLTSDEREVFQSSLEFMNEWDKKVEIWTRSIEVVISTDFLDFKALLDPKEIEKRELWASNYIELTKEHFHNIKNMRSQLEEKIARPNPFISRRVVEKLYKQFTAQEQYFEPMINAHLSFGNHLLEILRLLKKSDEWEFKDNSVVMDSEEDNKLFQSLLLKLDEDMEKALSYHDKINQ